ncbi:hypothetical protein J1605_002936 [Eschrichtius robustus]|uniref:Uncharacterized protein n=1 Tax=Eschrichtius robustus TaxID=9764 RepID=A0AB34HPP0_ESCRO|nr:hypothetical protein J1605_002936 [Eschrichtius robustus]
MSVEPRRPPRGWDARLPRTLPLHLWAAWPPGRDLPGRPPASRGRAVGGASARHGLAPPSGLRGALLPASASLQLSARSTFHAAASSARERQLRGRRARAPVSRSRLSPRECLAHECTFVSPRASGSRPRRRRRADREGQQRIGRRGLDGRPWRRTGPESR